MGHKTQGTYIATLCNLLSDASNIRARHPSHLAHHIGDVHTSNLPPYAVFFEAIVKTPIASFYCIYQFFVLHDNVTLRKELEYFCCSHPEWSVSRLPDPCANDSNLLCYTILPVLTQLMCYSFNHRIGLCLPRDASANIEEFEERGIPKNDTYTLRHMTMCR